MDERILVMENSDDPKNDSIGLKTPKDRDSRWSAKSKIALAVFILVVLTCGLFLSIHFGNLEQKPINIPKACENRNETDPKSRHRCKTIDHKEWNAFLKNFLTDNKSRDGVSYNAVNYADILLDRSLLDNYMKILEGIDLGSLTKHGQLAALLNAYNAFAVDMVVSNLCGAQICPSIRTVSNIPLGFSVWNWKRFNLGGSVYSLDDIEHGIIRPTFKDPRIHSAVNCASISCPDLRKEAYEESSLDFALTNQTQLWLQNPSKGIHREAGSSEIKLSKIFDWYRSDFDEYFENGLGNFIKTFGGTVGEQFVKDFGTSTTAWDITYFDYNWELNSA